MSLATRLLTIADIEGVNPCIDPTTYLGAGWTGHCSDLLALSTVDIYGRVWCVAQFFDAAHQYMFCRQLLALMPNPDALVNSVLAALDAYPTDFSALFASTGDALAAVINAGNDPTLYTAAHFALSPDPVGAYVGVMQTVEATIGDSALMSVCEAVLAVCP